MVQDRDLIADASFYICFLDCIGDSKSLIKILDNFKVHVPPKVNDEISKSKNWCNISEHKNLNFFSNSPFDVGKIIQPFLSKNEIKKGEYDIIITAYFFYNLSRPKEFFLIIDDAKPRKFVQNNLEELKAHMMGTVEFIKCCYLKCKIFNKDEVMNLYDRIEKSGFWIKREIMEKLRMENDLKKEKKIRMHKKQRCISCGFLFWRKHKCRKEKNEILSYPKG